MRIRTIKPEWLEDELLAGASDAARVLSVALILMADDYGCGRASIAEVAVQAWRYDMSRDDGAGAPETLAKASRALRELHDMGFVVLYSVAGQRYFVIRTWEKHQKVDHRGKRRIPEPPRADGDTRETLARPSEEPRATVAPDLGPPTPTEGPPTPTRTRARAMPLVVHLYAAWRRAFGAVPGVGSAEAVSECIRRDGSHPRSVHAHAERVALLLGTAEAEPDPAAWLDRTIAGFAADPYVKSKGAGFELYASGPGKYLNKPLAHPSATSDFTHADPTGDF